MDVIINVLYENDLTLSVGYCLNHLIAILRVKKAHGLL